MNWFGELRKEAGFTIQEILVVLIVSSLLVSFGLSLFQFTNKLLGKWTRKSEAYSLVNGVAQRVALDVQKSRSVIAVNDSSLALEYGIGKQVVFRFNTVGVWRNDVQMAQALQGQLLSRLTTDSTGMVDARITLTAIGANPSVHVSAPWSSRQQFSKSLKGSNAASH